MSQTLITTTLEEAQARHTRIQNSAEQIGRDLLAQRETNGWLLLKDAEGNPFENWTDYLRRGFTFSRKHLITLYNTASINERLEGEGISVKLLPSQAAALNAYPQALQAPIVQATLSRYNKITESNLRRVADVFTQAVQTGAVDVGDDSKPAAIDAALTLEDQEALKRQKGYITSNSKIERQYISRAATVTVKQVGDTWMALYAIPIDRDSEVLLQANETVKVSVWIEVEKLDTGVEDATVLSEIKTEAQAHV